MAEEFTPIETQEAFDAAIKDRIDRAKNSVREEYRDYETFKAKAEEYDTKAAEFQASITAKDSEIKELKGKVARYETDSVKTALAAEYHLEPGLKEFLIGKDEKEWRESAEKLAAMTKPKYPVKDYTEPAGPDSLAKQLQRQLRGD